MAGDAIQLLRSLNTHWLGFRFVISAWAQNDAASILAPVESPLETAGIAALGITEIDFPTASSGLIKVPSLSNRERWIPTTVSYTNLVLRAPTFRNNTLFKMFQKQARALSDPDFYPAVKNVFIIAEYEANTALDIDPIAVWTLNGCQASSFTPASANANSSDTVPLDELVLRVDNMSRL